MARTRRTRTRSRHTRRRHSRTRRGGDSAWQSMLKTVGDGQTQFNNALTIKSGENIATKQSNAIVPINNLNAQQVSLPKLPQNGGKRRKKGGYWTSVLNQALVPFTLLGLQQIYGKKRTRKAKN